MIFQIINSVEVSFAKWILTFQLTAYFFAAEAPVALGIILYLNSIKSR
jgi:hypothetical protein